MIKFLTVSQVIQIHDRQLEEFGGLPGYRDSGIIESIITRVQNRHDYEGTRDLFELAAMYLLAIARGHGFNDANKRTAAMTAYLFLAMNNVRIRLPLPFADFVAEAAQGLHSVDAIAAELRNLRV